MSFSHDLKRQEDILGLQECAALPDSSNQRQQLVLSLISLLPLPKCEKPVLVFQLHDGLHSSVVVIEVDSPHHLGPFQVPNFHRDFADGVAANELHNLLGGGVPCVHFNGRQLDILNAKVNTKQCVSSRLTAHPVLFKTHQCNPLFIHG